jgi:uncharacterized protein (TIGR02145 family)
MSRSVSIFFILILGFFFSCEKADHEPPEAGISIQPLFGDINTVFLLDASPSKDNMTDNFRLQARWDIDGDDIWESDFSIIKQFAWKYNAEGVYRIVCEVMDDHGNVASFSRNMQVAPILRDSVFTDHRDGKTYSAVFLYDRWWMQQNLDYGIKLENGQQGSDNSIVEKYKYPDERYDSLYGGYYSWNEATDYKRDVKKGICPDGWRLPTQGDIDHIVGLLFFTTDYASYLAPGKSYKLDMELTGKYINITRSWHLQGRTGNFWIYQEQPFDKFMSWAYYANYKHYDYTKIYNPVLYTDYNPLSSISVEWQKEWGDYSYQKVALPVRCVKDHELN